MNTPAGRAAVLRKARTAAGQYNINIDGLASLPIPAAPFDRQAAFAGFAEECDALSTQHRDALGGERQLASALLAHAFTGELTAAWRTEHADELAAEAAARDAAVRVRVAVGGRRDYSPS